MFVLSSSIKLGPGLSLSWFLSSMSGINNRKCFIKARKKNNKSIKELLRHLPFKHSIGCLRSSVIKVPCLMQFCPPCNAVCSGHFCVCNRVRRYQKPSGGHVLGCTLCARVSERACTEPTYMQQEYSRIVMTAANTQRPNISHVIHDMH